MKLLLIFITLLIQAVLYSQNKEKDNINNQDSLEIFLKVKQKKIDSLKMIDYISLSYKYLDSDFNIEIDKKKFDKIIYGKPEMIKNYKDSLMIILHYELGDYDAVNIAFHSILFNWKKMSYYIWESEQKTKEIGKSYGFKHPYTFLKFLKDKDIENRKKTDFFIELKTKLSNYRINNIDLKPYDRFLNYAFRHNPERIKDMEEYSKIKNRKK